MVTRSPVSTIFNKWNDAARVDVTDMNVEQNRNVQADASIISNHFGSGVLPETIEQPVLFDTFVLSAAQAALVGSNDFDGTGLDATVQPSDTTLGNQLEVELTDSEVFGHFSVKVLVIGLDFQGNTQFDTFTFFKNEKQVTKHHYTRILTIFFNDFFGNNKCSRARGGRVVIRESASYQLSRDPIMVEQSVEPNLFFRDFKVSGITSTGGNTISLATALQAGMGPEYSVDSLNIQTTVKQNRLWEASDVTTKYGQKFQATTNNIQKVTVLLGVSPDGSAPIENKFDWTGDFVVSIYELQTSVSCPSDIVPELAIDFDPNANPIAQLSLDQADFRDYGYVLTDVLQPVDFVFSDTQLGSTTNPKIVAGRYYVVTMNRAGAANSGAVFTGVANSRIANSCLTIYSGSWVDVQEEDLWFQIWHDAAKVSDGSAYDDGNGIQISKTTQNAEGATVDYCLDAQAFADSGENTVNTAVVQAIPVSSQEEQDERTGNQVYSRQQFEPEFSFVTNNTLSDLQELEDPLIIGASQDTNPKLNPILNKIQTFPSLVNGDIFTIINPDPDLLSLNLLGSKLIPNNNASGIDYRIFRTRLCVDGYGDINGDGVIDSADIALASGMVGESLFFDSTQQAIIDGYFTTLQLIRADVDGDGYISVNDVTLITQYVARTINSFPVGSSFNHLELQVTSAIFRNDGYHDCGIDSIDVDGYARTSGSANPDGTIFMTPLSDAEKEYYGYAARPDMDSADAVFTAVPFVAVPFQVKPIPYWQDFLLAFSSDARYVPAAFTSDTNPTVDSCTNTLLSYCTDLIDVVPDFDPGRNDIMIPNNLIMKGGQILNPDGTHYKTDFETYNIVLELPEYAFVESSIDVFQKLIVDRGDGFTSAGFKAGCFADFTPVGADALARNQIKFVAGIQSFNPNLDGYSEIDGYGVIVDDVIAIHMSDTGILTMTIQDLSVDAVYLTKVTKIQVTVMLKKAGWTNNNLVVESNQIVGLIT